MADVAKVRERSDRVRAASPGRHVAAAREPRFTASFRALGRLAYEGAQVSAHVLDLSTGTPLVSIDDRIVLPTADIGKVLLLIEVSARLTARENIGLGIIDKPPVNTVGESGVWQHMQAPALPVADLATLVGATSDNLATNLLLSRVGLDAVRARTESLGLSRTALLDFARNTRGPDDAPQLSVGSTAELARLFGMLAREEVVDAVTSQRVMGWISLNSDLSMVASAFGLDPLSHRSADHGTLLINKTGADTGVRSEAGALRGRRTAVSYAVSVQFDDDSLARRLSVVDAMRTVGQELLEYVH
ncbi:beta-lactamase class A [Conyzicola lurida]|uniref:Beta-lactamase class A n=1 Tax=Conyzicola lurida TaxID=1172621 RepID=A0A841ARE0_9MICO|nr:beta-lactamase class A [Conyzicola lurida]